MATFFEHVMNIPGGGEYDMLKKLDYPKDFIWYERASTALAFMGALAGIANVIQIIRAKKMHTIPGPLLWVLLFQNVVLFFVLKNFKIYGSEKRSVWISLFTTTAMAFLILLLIYLKNDPSYSVKKGCDGQVCAAKDDGEFGDIPTDDGMIITNAEG